MSEHATTLAAIAAAADAAATPPAPPAPAPAPTTEAPPAPAPAAPPAAPPAPAVSTVSAAAALEMAAMAIPTAREQLSTLATACRADASEDGFRTACLKVAAGPAAAAAPPAPLVTAPPTPAVTKGDEKPKAAIPAPGDVYGARAQAMAS